jgi:hypothetical protein
MRTEEGLTCAGIAATQAQLRRARADFCRLPSLGWSVVLSRASGPELSGARGCEGDDDDE